LILVRGLGLIGTSIGLALAGEERLGWDPNPAHAEVALRRGAVDRLVTEDADPSGATVVLAGPPSAILAELRPGRRGAGRLYLDVGSVKAPIVARAAATELPFVGGHPLAGNEGSGPEAADATLFAGRTFFLTPVSGREALVEPAADLVRRLGARPVVLDAAQHDAAVARTSHLPYVLARALLTLAEDQPRVAQGPAFAALTRPGRSPAALWAEILGHNRAAVREAWEALKAVVEDLL
jgi:prephenate dehydrogenase